jgi:hypothetical protein
MSGGFFDYKQYYIIDIADTIERELNRQGKEKPKNNEHNNIKEFYETYSDIVQEKMKETIKQLRIAEFYSQRVDRFLSGDETEEDFIKNFEKIN